MSQAIQKQLEGGVFVVTCIILILGLGVRMNTSAHRAELLPLSTGHPNNLEVSDAHKCPYACCVPTGQMPPLNYKCEASR